MRLHQSNVKNDSNLILYKTKKYKETPSIQLPRNNSVVCEDISANNKIHVFT